MQPSPTLERMLSNLVRNGLEGAVRIIPQRSCDVKWSDPIRLLFIDGLHDYQNVAADFNHFARFVVPDGLVAFHDYADYWPGVMRCVNELVESRSWHLVAHVRSMVVLRFGG